MSLWDPVASNSSQWINLLAKVSWPGRAELQKFCCPEAGFPCNGCLCAVLHDAAWLSAVCELSILQQQNLFFALWSYIEFFSWIPL